jgi:hypothetical protein
MSKNLYFRAAFQRENLLKTFFLDAFLKISSYPRLILEVFIRKNFGQRYFSLASVITALVMLLIVPVLANRLPSFSSDYDAPEPSFWSRYTTWYLFVGAFCYFAYLRWNEIRRNPSVFDFGKFTLYSGDINQRFFKIRLFGRPTVRQIEIFFEPALFIFTGLFLMLLGQKLGDLLMFCSVFYCLCYHAAYRQGDNFIMDIIDEKIMNEEMENGFVDEMLAENTRGVRFYMNKPTSHDLRQKVAESFIEKDSFEEQISYAL